MRGITSLLLVLTGMWSHIMPRALAARAADLDAAFKIVERAVADGDVPGAAALVAHDGKVIREEAYGLRDLEHNLPFRPDTICWIASMTKAITATAIMLLVEDGKLRLDDPVDKYLPEFAGRTNFRGRHHPFTIRQLLLYTSGLPNNPPTRKGGDRIGGALTDLWLSQRSADIIEGIASAQLLFEPGTNQEYSSAGYFVLGRLIDVVAGKSYPAFVQERIFDPLGMRDSTYRPPPANAGRMAALFQQQRGARRLVYRFNPALQIQNPAPDGGIFSTMRDMAQFEQMFLDNNGSVLSRASVAEMHRAHRPGFVSGPSHNVEVSTAIGFTVMDGLWMHGGSSGVTGWGDHRSGTVGMLFIQFPEDQRKGDQLRAAFRQAVQSALGGTPAPGMAPAPTAPAPTPAKKVSRYDVFETELKSSASYANPFADVSVALTFKSPSGRSLTAHGFFDGDNVWRIRFAPDEVGTWSYASTCSDAANRGLHGQTGTLACVASANKGFIRVDPVRKYWFAYDDGSPFWGNGDTCYNIVNGISPEDRTRYLDTRAGQGFNFVRLHVCGSPAPSPFFDGTDLDRFDLAHFRKLDAVMADLKARNMRAEVIVLNRYHRPFTDPAGWTDAREARYARYIVSRLAAFTQVFLWTVCNEYEVYPNGKYGDAASEDNAWAERIGELLHNIDPHRHPTTVHPWEQSLMDRGKLMAERFGTSRHLDVLTQQYYGDARLTDRRKNIWDGPGIRRGPAPNPERPFYIGSGEGVDRVVRLDRTHQKPVINTETSYEHYDGSNYGGWAATDLARRQAWRVFMGGGAAHAAGFEGTLWAVKLVGTPGRSAFFLEDRGLAAQLKYRYEFITTRTRFEDMVPAQSLVNAPNVCLANPGWEYAVYAPGGGIVALDLSGVSAVFSVEWLDPRNGTYRTDSPASGGSRRNFAAENLDDWVLHLKKL